MNRFLDLRESVFYNLEIANFHKLHSTSTEPTDKVGKILPTLLRKYIDDRPNPCETSSIKK